MTNDELYFRLMADKGLYTSCLATVVSIQKRYCKMRLISATSDEKNLPLINVPVGRVAGTSQYIQVGDTLVVLFNKWDIGKWLISKEEQVVGEPEKELQFDRDNAFALPIVFDDKLEENFPNKFTVHHLSEFEKDVHMSEKLDVDKTIKSLEDVIAQAISLINHLHSGVESGGSNTGGAI